MADKGGKADTKPKQNQNQQKQNNQNQTKPSKQEQQPKQENNNNNTTNPSPKQEAPVVQQTVASTPAPATTTPAQPSQPSQNPQPNQPKPAPLPKEKGRGNVKAVLSGDTIVVVHLEKNQNGPPQEREITISNINAPKMGRRKSQKSDATEDEPFAWQSREFLRQSIIGKQVTYTVEYKSAVGQNNKVKEYGVVFLVNGQNQESLAKIIVAKGWAKARRPQGKGELREDIAELIQLEEEAQKSGLGLFNKSLTREETVRPIAEINPTEYFEKNRGKPLNAVVEQVITGSTLRVTLLPAFLNIPLYLSGVECPFIDQQDRAEPFGREAKFFSEYYVLNRDVSVILEGVDKYNLFGSVSVQSKNLAEQLLAAGLAKFVEWSGAKTAFQEQLRKAEKNAREHKIRIWSLPSNSPQPTNNNNNNNNNNNTQDTTKVKKEISGQVVKIIHGGAIKVKVSKGEYEVYFSSIKLPRQGNSTPRKNETRDEAIERSLAWEAKEYTRKRLIGQKVRCVLDYSREVKKSDTESVERPFYSVYLEKNNIGVELVDHGLATAVDHRGSDPRSRDYEHIIFAEKRAKQELKGIHAPKEKATIIYINDLSNVSAGGKDKDNKEKDDKQSASLQKVKQFLPFLKRGGRQRGVVEHVVSASKLKIYVPKEGCIIPLSLSGINVPRGFGEEPEPFAKEAYDFILNHALQHDVEFDVLSQGRTGTFIGNIWINKENLAAQLLAAGLADINRASLKDNQNATEFIIAEDSAKKGRKNLWHDYDPVKEEEERQKRAEADSDRKKPKQDLADIVVTDIVDATRFYVQIANTADTKGLEDLMKGLAAQDESTTAPYSPKVGEIVKAQFTADDVWYRAEVLKVSGSDYEVLYIDYGNSETIPDSRIRKLEAAFNLHTLKRQAYEAQLAYVIPPAIDEEYGVDAADLFRDLVWGKNLVGNIERKERLGERDDGKEKLYLMLVDSSNSVLVNGVMLREGLARLDRIMERKARTSDDKVAQSLKMEEDLAKSDHLFIWEYGDPGFDDPDDERRQPPAKKK